jgi:hypothetical protein
VLSHFERNACGAVLIEHRNSFNNKKSFISKLSPGSTCVLLLTSVPFWGVSVFFLSDSIVKKQSAASHQGLEQIT